MAHARMRFVSLTPVGGMRTPQVYGGLGEKKRKRKGTGCVKLFELAEAVTTPLRTLSREHNKLCAEAKVLLMVLIGCVIICREATDRNVVSSTQLSTRHRKL